MKNTDVHINDKQKEGMRAIMREVGVADNKKAVKIAMVGVLIGALGLLVAFGGLYVAWYSNAALEQTAEVQNAHMNLTMVDEQRIDRLEKEVFEQAPVIMIDHKTIQEYELEYLVVRENSTGGLIVFGDFDRHGTKGTWAIDGDFEVEETENGSVYMRKV